MSEKQMYWYKRSQGITSINFFPSSNFNLLHKVFISIWNYSKLYGKFQSKIWMFSCGNELIKSKQVSLFTIITYINYFCIYLKTMDSIDGFYQTRWYNKRILGKDYSVPQDFSWIENYKLIQRHHKISKYLILQNTCVHRRSSYL